MVIARGDAVDVYADPGRGGVVSAFSLSPRSAARLGWFLLWRWWVRACLLGLRQRLRERDLVRAADARLRFRHEAPRGPRA